MATYIELRNLINDSLLRNKTAAAVIIAAQGVLDDAANFPTPTADTVLQQDRLAWAARAFNNVEGEARKVLMSVLAANKDITVAQITGATDAQLQTNANAVVDLLAQHDKPAIAPVA